jgi:putative transposase
MVLAQAAAGNTLEAVHERGDGHFRRIVHQQMHMIVFAVHLHEFSFKISADRREYAAHVFERGGCEHVPPVFGHEDQMHVHSKNAVSPRAIILESSHRPMYPARMIERKAALFRLYPTPEQAAQMAQIAGACRFVYNLALEQRRDWYRPGRKFTFASQCREVTQLRAEVDWLKDAPVHALQQALRDLDRAYQNWWAGRAHAPRPRKKGMNDSFRFPDPVSLAVERTGKSSGRIKLPKLGWVALRERNWREIPGTICNVTVTRRAGQWFAAVQCEREIAEPVPCVLPPVGIDMGVAVFAALSNGTSIAPANHGRKALRSLRKAQRDLSRKKRGSSNRRKAIRRVARIQQRVANARKDFLHQHSTTIAQNHGTVVVEALKVRAMSASAKGTAAEPGKMVRQKAGLNRAILDQGWGMFRIMLAYKLARRGGQLIEVPAAYTSQTCAACGVVDARNRQDQARFVCIGCGHTANADMNAAINILRRTDCALKPVEGHRTKRPVEAGTIRRAA